MPCLTITIQLILLMQAGYIVLGVGSSNTSSLKSCTKYFHSTNQSWLEVSFFLAWNDWTLPWWVLHHLQASQARQAWHWCHPLLQVYSSEVNVFVNKSSNCGWLCSCVVGQWYGGKGTVSGSDHLICTFTVSFTRVLRTGVCGAHYDTFRMLVAWKMNSR